MFVPPKDRSASAAADFYPALLIERFRFQKSYTIQRVNTSVVTSRKYWVYSQREADYQTAPANLHGHSALPAGLDRGGERHAVHKAPGPGEKAALRAWRHAPYRLWSRSLLKNGLRHTAPYGRGSVSDSKRELTGSEPRAQQAVFRVFQQASSSLWGSTRPTATDESPAFSGGFSSDITDFFSTV